MHEPLKKALDSLMVIRTTRRAPFCMGLEYLEIPNLFCAAQEYGEDFDRTNELFSSVHANNETSSTQELLLHPCITEATKDHTPENVIVVPYVNSTEIEDACASRNFRLFAPQAKLVYEMEGKDSAMAFLEEVCPEAVIPSKVQPFGECKWDKESSGIAIQRLDQIYTGGKGTILIRTEDEFENLSIPPDEVVKTAAFIEGPSLNINAVASSEGTVTTDFSLQIIGPPDCSVNTASYCGNDWDSAQALSPAMHEEVHRLTRVVGDALFARGYKGWFGMDFLVDSHTNHVYVMEINPRMQGSTSMITLTECLDGLTPLLDLHLMSHLGIPFDQSAEDYSQQYRNTTKGAHILIRIGDDPITFSSTCPPGLYASKGEEWSHTNDSIQFKDAREKQGVVVQGIPPLGKEVFAHDRIATIQSPHQVLDGTNSSVLIPSIQSLIALLREGYTAG